MSTGVVTIEAQPRARVGKGAARSTRREGLVPAVVYGEGAPPTTVVLERKMLTRHLETGHFLTQLVDLKVGADVIRVVPKAIQFDPVTDFAVHADFLRVGPNTRIVVNIPMAFSGHEASPGMKRGGTLTVVRHTVQVRCRAAAMPDELMVDISPFDIGDSIHISAVQLPEGVTPTIADRDFTIATITAPSALRGGASSG